MAERLLKVAVIGVGHLGRHHARVLAGIEVLDEDTRLAAFVLPGERHRAAVHHPALANVAACRYEPAYEGRGSCTVGHSDHTQPSR